MNALVELVGADSYLEDAFLRWVLTPAAFPAIARRVTAQVAAQVGDRQYRVDYVIRGAGQPVAVELDGFVWHGSRQAFTYDRLRQNDLAAAGYVVLRFSYDAIRRDTVRCVQQVQALLGADPDLAPLVVADPVVPVPDMDPDPMHALLSPSPATERADMTYFDEARVRLDQRPLRPCQQDALAALADYYRRGHTSAAVVMSVGSGKTTLGVTSCLAFARRRAMIVTPGKVVRGTFGKALDHEKAGNSLYGLGSGPIIPGIRPPRVLVLDADEEPVGGISRERLLDADIIVTNFHSLGDASQPEHLLTKLEPGDVDFIVVDEAHIAAAESYQRLFAHFAEAKTLLMSACFQRLDGKPIDADIVYRYRLIDSTADGWAKNLRLHPFAPDSTVTTYEMVYLDGRRQEIVGRDALLAIINDERKLARITAKSHAPIRQVMGVVRECLDAQTELLFPVKPRALFSALGEAHARQLAMLAEEASIPCGVLHHSMPENERNSVLRRFEEDSGDLQAIVQLRMLGQGYDFPPITVVVPMRPYGSFSDFYQFVGRGIRVIQHPALTGRVTADQQFLDLVYHAELGLDGHVDTIRLENDMDPATEPVPDPAEPVDVTDLGARVATQGPEAFVLFERGVVVPRVVHDADRVEQRRKERETEMLAQRYAAYAATSTDPVSFEHYAAIVRQGTGG